MQPNDPTTGKFKDVPLADLVQGRVNMPPVVHDSMFVRSVALKVGLN